MTEIIINSGVFGTGSVSQVTIAGWTIVNDAQNATWIPVDTAA